MDKFAGKLCRIVRPSPYMDSKYGTPIPEIRIEDTDRVVLGSCWGNAVGNIAAMLYGARSGLEGLPMGGTVYYGKVFGRGELVHESEIEEVGSENPEAPAPNGAPPATTPTQEDPQTPTPDEVGEASTDKDTEGF